MSGNQAGGLHESQSDTQTPVSSEKRALLARRLWTTSEAPEILRGEPIAIVGLGCRFPGADSPSAFWRVLREGVDTISPIPAERWDAAAFFDPDPQADGRMYVRWGGFLNDLDRFDAEFFGIAPREAERLDPQQRLALEMAWEALEQAGQTRQQLSGTLTGVFIGVSTHDYGDRQTSAPDQLNAYSTAGTAGSIVANRLSYFLNLHGPSLAIDTACSSSLVAVHLACQSLRGRDCHLALAGGVNAILTPEPMIGLSRARMMAPDGRCKTFDARADGYVRGEGCGMVVLKRLADALADHDPVLAVIRGSAINQDGRTTGLTAPNATAQERLLREALRQASVPPEHVTYVEAHGTGTSLGDPIEVEALTAVLGGSDRAAPRCFLGSVKTNIGHLEAAAGIAGLLKVVLAIEHRQVPASLHLQHLNPHINLSGTRFVIPGQLEAWETGSRRRCAGVSSFGFGGTNAHVIVEEAPALPESDRSIDPGPHVLAVSGHTADARQAMACAYRDWLREDRGDVATICLTAGRRRSHHDYRLAIVGETAAELAALLEIFGRGEAHPNIHATVAASGRPRRMAFVFSGHGGERPHVPLDVMERLPAFRDTLAACDRALIAHTGWSVTDLLAGRDAGRSWHDTSVVQPTVFAIQTALAALWRSWGLEPEAVVGHSLGEIAAAHVAGVLSLDEAAWLVCQRGRLMADTQGQGGMTAVEATRTEADRIVETYRGRLSVAACNSPVTTVLSGETAALEEVAASLRAQERSCRHLPVAYPFHGPMMEPVGRALAAVAACLKPAPATVPFVSSVTGRFCGGLELDGAYWGRNVAEPVHFATALECLLQSNHDIFLELGPHPLLQRPIQETLGQHGCPGTVLCCLRSGRNPVYTLRQAFASLHALGMPVDWRALYPHHQRPVPLPPYAWQRRRYWFTPERPPASPARHAAPSQGSADRSEMWLGQRQHSPLHDAVVFEARWRLETMPLLAEHRLHGVEVVPAVMMLEMVLTGARMALAAEPPLQFDDVLISSLFALGKDEERRVQLIFEPQPGGATRFRLVSGVDRDHGRVVWTEHAQGRLRLSGDVPPGGSSLEDVRERSLDAVPPAQLFEQLARRGLAHGPSFQRLVELRVGEGLALGQIMRPAGFDAASRSFPPEMFESGLLVAAAALLRESLARRDAATEPTVAGPGDPGDPPDGPATTDLYIPLSMDRLTVYQWPGASFWSHASLAHSPDHAIASPEIRSAALAFVDEAGSPVVRLDGLKVKRVSAKAVARRLIAPADNDLYRVAWQRSERVPLSADRPPAGDGRRCLVFVDSTGMGEALVARLRAEGFEPLSVLPAEAYAPPHDGQATVNPARPDDFVQLWHDASPDRLVLFLWGLDDMPRHTLWQGALHAAQALARAERSDTRSVGRPQSTVEGRESRLWIVTRESQAVTGTEQPATPHPSALWGLGRSFAMEHPDAWGGCIDLDGGIEPTEAAVAILREATTGAEDQIAIRSGHRLVARLEPATVPAAVQPGLPAIRGDRTYLVTGGLGAIGSHVIRWLAQNGARHLVSLGRRSPDDPEAARLRANVPAGVDLLVLQADVSDRAQVSAALTTLRPRMPSLGGIFHLAGLLDDGMLVHQDWRRFERVLASKVEGGWHLHELTRDAPLEYFVLFSSVAGVLGSAGQVSYAAANAWLDGLARFRRAHGLPAVSLAWGVWDAGMPGLLNDGERARLATFGVRPLPVASGLERLERVLASAWTEAVIMSMDWSRFGASPLAERNMPLLHAIREASAAADAGQPSPVRQRLETLPEDERPTQLAMLIREQIRRVLGLGGTDALDDERGFFQMGMDSLMAVELQQTLQRALDVSLPATVTFDYPNIRALTDAVSQRLWPSNASRRVEAPADPSLTAAMQEIGQLSDAELDRLLARQAGGIGAGGSARSAGVDGEVA